MIASATQRIRGLLRSIPPTFVLPTCAGAGSCSSISSAMNGFVVGIVNRKKRFRTAQIVALAGVTAQEFSQRFFAAVERLPIMVHVDRLFVPCRHDYDPFGNARSAARSFAFGAGGFSSRARSGQACVSYCCA